MPPLRSDPATVEEWLNAATAQHLQGHLSEARRLYDELLMRHPEHALGLFRSGLLDLQEQQAAAALAKIERAAAADPREVRFQLGLGQTLQALNRWDDACAVYQCLAAAHPNDLDTHAGLALSLHRLGRLPAAAAAYRRILELRPDDPRSLGNLGAVLRDLGEIDQALEALRSAHALEPEVTSHAINLGMTLGQRRDFASAERILRDACARAPQNPEAAFNLGNALRGLGRTQDAIVEFSRAANLRANYADALNNIGTAQQELGQYSAARDAFEAALRARPDYVLALNNAGCLQRKLGHLDAAEELLRRGLALAPEHAALHDNLGNVLKDAGELDAALDCYRRALAIDPLNSTSHSNLVYALSFQASDPEPILEESARWNARFAAPFEQTAVQIPRDLSAARRLKIGYVSADFRDHCQSLFTTPVLANHDHQALEVFCYSSVERIDACTRRLQGYADVWRDVRRLDDADLCDVVREDRIDILVDLTMHMSGGRPLLFARGPAPISIAWLAYPGTTGIRAMQYRISDPRLDPAGFDLHYSETTLRLEDSFWCYDPLTDQPLVNALPALERGFVTFGCLNNPCKLTNSTLSLWGGVLHAVADSRLLLMAPSGRHRLTLTKRLHAHGIAPERVSFVEFQPRADYLRTYREIDIGLDTLPYNGHTTSLDALWMGIPTVSRVGRTCVGRGGLSQLFQLNLAELAAESDAGFIAAATRLAADLPYLGQLRSELRARMARSSLMNAARFTGNLEALYRRAWSAYRASQLL